MTYTIKRHRKKGDFRLTNLPAVENLDVFGTETNNRVKRLWIDHRGLSKRAMATSNVQSKYYDFATAQLITFYGKERRRWLLQSNVSFGWRTLLEIDPSPFRGPV